MALGLTLTSTLALAPPLALTLTLALTLKRFAVGRLAKRYSEARLLQAPLPWAGTPNPSPNPNPNGCYRPRSLGLEP